MHCDILNVACGRAIGFGVRGMLIVTFAAALRQATLRMSKCIDRFLVARINRE